MATATGSREVRSTTVRIPSAIYDKAKNFVDADRTGTRSISLNDFFVSAIQAYVKLQDRRRIDAAFLCMSEDADYQKEACLLAEEFETSDWEALQLGEG